MPTLPYRPHPALRSGHLQTMMVGLVCGHRPSYQAAQIEVPLRDGERLIVHDEQAARLPKNSDLVILIHGLGGDHRSPYLERLARDSNLAGFRAWRVDLRGCGAGLKHAWRPANAGRSDDLADVLQMARTLHPESRIHVVGFSLSGNIVLKLLGEIVEESHAAHEAVTSSTSEPGLASAIAIAPPCNLQRCADNMDRSSRWLYTAFYLKMLRGQVEERRNAWPRWNRVPRTPEPKTIRQFDARYTAPLSGFPDPVTYYTKSSSIDLLPRIKTPTTVILDRDDPIVPFNTFGEASFSPSTSVIVTRRGGHMGYFARDVQGRNYRWLEHRVLELLKNSRG